MLLSTSDEDVLTAAADLGKKLQTLQSESTSSEFESILVACNEAITETTRLEYGEVCDAGSDCC
ncbi:hypothetical protein SAMN04487947_2658 [Halogeometricum rufum]|uniref:Uncharacterized protein n=1 Tax=Halogeometricum rufum TaxID=553469 RepID=A0A1I6HYR5_9EURY|nr:halo-CC-star protein HcsS [Halogeometricum rufum]SFR59544.1 hypothetical protein SAMN04487947_2658 [Halogeometricum rufum]